MDGLEHGIAVAEVGAARRAYAALQLRGLVGDDVAVEVGKDKDLEAGADGGVDEVGGHDVDVPVLDLHLRVVLRHLVADGGELAVGLFHDVGLGDDGDILFAVFARVFKGGAGDAARAGVGDDLEIHGQAGKLDAAAAEGVFAFGVLAEERPVHALFGNAHGAHVGVEVESAAQRDVGALQRAALGGGGGAFEEDVAALDGRKHFGGHGLAARKAVFDGQAVDGAQFQRAAGDLVREQDFQHARGLVYDDGADAVAANNADDRLWVRRLLLRGGAFHALHAAELFFQEGAEVFHGPFDLRVHCLPSLV